MRQTPRFEWHCNCLFFYWRIDYRVYWNKFHRQVWHNEDVWFVRVGWNRSRISSEWFGIQNDEYDSHLYRGIVVFGFAFGYGNSYQTERLEPDTYVPRRVQWF